MDARTRGVLDGLAGPIDVELAGARQSANHRLLDALGDLGDGVEIALRGDREARLDDVHAHGVEEVGDLQFLFEGHGGTGTLLAVAQGCIENKDVVGVGDLWVGTTHHGMDPAWLLLRHVLFLSFACRAGKGWARAMKRLGATFDPLSAYPDKAQTRVAQGPIRRRVSRPSRLAAGIFPSVARVAALERVSLTGSLPASIKLGPLKPNCVANGKHNRHGGEHSRPGSGWVWHGPAMGPRLGRTQFACRLGGAMGG